MNVQDFPGSPDTSQVAALDEPFAWPQSGLQPLPWFPFTVAASDGAGEAAARIARRVEQAYWYLRKALRFTPRFRLLVLSREDWPRYAEVDAYGIAHYDDRGHLVVGSEPADAWLDVSRAFALALPAGALRKVRSVHGAHPDDPAAPDLGPLAESLMAHELARLIADQARASFPLHWLKDAFANYALVAVLGETDPDALHRVGTLAEAAREIDSVMPRVAASAGRPALTPFEAVLMQLELTRAAYPAYADDRSAPLGRWFALARKPASVSRASIARQLARDVHPAIGAIAGSWDDEIPHAA
ncbi:MAG: hypothetical protein U1F54_10620 [Burkholderiales bacterium]